MSEKKRFLFKIKIHVFKVKVVNSDHFERGFKKRILSEMGKLNLTAPSTLEFLFSQFFWFQKKRLGPDTKKDLDRG